MCADSSRRLRARLGVELKLSSASTSGEIDTRVRNLVRERPTGLSLHRRRFLTSRRGQLVALAHAIAARDLSRSATSPKLAA